MQSYFRKTIDFEYGHVVNYLLSLKEATTQQNYTRKKVLTSTKMYDMIVNVAEPLRKMAQNKHCKIIPQ